MADVHNVTHHPGEAHFDVGLEGHRGVLRYAIHEVGEGRVMVIPSVVVDRPIEGRGVAGALARAALEWARAEGWRVDPVCPYVEAWMRRHPEFAGMRA